MNSLRRRMVVVCLGYAVSASVLVGVLAVSMPWQLTDMRLCDSYFGSDISRRYEVLTTRFSLRCDSMKHPLFPLLYVPLHVAKSLFRTSDRKILPAALAVNAMIWACLCWSICFGITRRILDATVFALLALSTAGSILWLPVVETYAFGSTTILIPLFVLALPGKRTNISLHIAAFVASSAITITNVMASFIAQVFSLKPRGIVLVSTLGVLLLAGVSILQKEICPHAAVLFSAASSSAAQRDYAAFAHVKQPVAFTNTFVMESLLPGEVVTGTIPAHHAHVGGTVWWPAGALPVVDIARRVPNVDYQGIFSVRGPLLVGIRCLWGGLLLTGMISIMMHAKTHSGNIAFPVLVAGQWALHVIYGHETLIYSAHWMPLMVFITAANSLKRWRKYTLPCAGVLLIVLFLCNITLYFSIVRVIADFNVNVP